MEETKTIYFLNSHNKSGLRDNQIKTSACFRGEGCSYVPMVERSQYIRSKNPLHKHFLECRWQGGWGQKFADVLNEWSLSNFDFQLFINFSCKWMNSCSKSALVQVSSCQKFSFLNQLTHNMTRDYSFTLLFCALDFCNFQKSGLRNLV